MTTFSLKYTRSFLLQRWVFEFILLRLIEDRSRIRLQDRARNGTNRAALRVGRSDVSLVPAGPDRSIDRTKVRRVIAPAGRQGISPRYSATACIALPLPCLVLPFASLPASSPRRFAVCWRRWTTMIMLATREKKEKERN